MRILFVIPLMVVAGCWSDAEHLNPLDPLSPDFDNTGAIDGVVQDRSFNPLAGVLLALSPAGRSTTSASDGRFRFEAVEPGDYSISLTRADLQPLTASVSVQLGKTASNSHTMNILPMVESSLIATTHVSRWWPQDDLYRLDVQATPHDDDGLIDIATASLVIPHISFTAELNPTPDPGVFGLSLTEADLNGTSLHSLLGKELRIDVMDQPGAAGTSGPLFLSRIIDYEPDTSSPSGSEEVPGGSPVLSWPTPAIPFTHSFQVDIYRVDDDIATNVYSVGAIPSSQLSHTSATTLATGQYYWTLSIVDEYGNRSRSKEAGFIVP